MKKTFLAIFAALIATVVFLPLSAADAPKNEVANGDFNLANQKNEQLPARWWGQKHELLKTETGNMLKIFHLGTACPPGNIGIMRQLANDRKVHISFKASSTGGILYVIALPYTDVKGAKRTNHPTVIITRVNPDDTMKTYEADYTFKANQWYNIMFRFVANKSGNAAIIDDVVMTEVNNSLNP